LGNLPKIIKVDPDLLRAIFFHWGGGGEFGGNFYWGRTSEILFSKNIRDQTNKKKEVGKKLKKT